MTAAGGRVTLFPVDAAPSGAESPLINSTKGDIAVTEERPMPRQKQIIIAQFLTGVDDDVITKGTMALKSKLMQALRGNQLIDEITARPGDILSDDWYSGPIGELGDSGVLFLRGHGNWRLCTLGGRDAPDVFTMLDDLPRGAVVNVVGCNSAVARANPDDTLGEVSVNSFSGTLHRLLKAKQTRVVARSQPVEVQEDGRKLTYGNRDLDLGSVEPRERMMMMLDKDSKRPGSKWEYYWQGDTQMFRAIY